VLDGGTDAEAGVGEELLDGLGHEVGARVAHAGQLVVAGVVGLDGDVHLGGFLGDVELGHCSASGGRAIGYRLSAIGH
jgi:hypothetical protein